MQCTQFCLTQNIFSIFQLSCKQRIFFSFWDALFLPCKNNRFALQAILQFKMLYTHTCIQIESFVNKNQVQCNLVKENPLKAITHKYFVILVKYFFLRKNCNCNLVAWVRIHEIINECFMFENLCLYIILLIYISFQKEKLSSSKRVTAVKELLSTGNTFVL